MSKKLRFVDLAIGETFEFQSVRDYPFSGFERGPWTKVSARTYEKTGPRAMKCRIGTVKAEVFRVEV